MIEMIHHQVLERSVLSIPLGAALVRLLAVHVQWAHAVVSFLVLGQGGLASWRGG